MIHLVDKAVYDTLSAPWEQYDRDFDNGGPVAVPETPDHMEALCGQLIWVVSNRYLGTSIQWVLLHYDHLGEKEIPYIQRGFLRVEVGTSRPYTSDICPVCALLSLSQGYDSHYSD